MTPNTSTATMPGRWMMANEKEDKGACPASPVTALPALRASKPAAFRGVASTGAEDGWIEWKGGDCPVEPEAVVQVRLRAFSTPLDPAPADPFYWSHLDGPGDIIAYKVVKPGQGK